MFTNRSFQSVALAAAVAMIATLVTLTAIRADAADPLAPWVTDNASQVVEATVVSAETVTAADASIWTNYTLETSDGQLQVLDRGGFDQETGRWQYASNTTELLVGMDVIAALVPANGFVPAELGSDNTWVIYGGASGVSVASATEQSAPSVRSAAVLPSSYFTGSRWQAMPIPVRINPNIDSAIIAGSSDAVQRSIRTWAAISGSDAVFNYLGTSNTITAENPPFTNTVFAAALAGELGKTVWTGSADNGTITSYEILLNSGTLPYSSTWTIGAKAGSYDAESVILHELGHVIGIGHTQETFSIMYPILYRNESKKNLSNVDVEAARTLYPTSECGFATLNAIIGTPGNDVLQGTAGDDLIIGGDGDDTILGAGGNDKLCGDGGADTIWAQDGNDTVYGGSGADKLRGGNGNDTIYGGDGNDDANAGRDNDRVYGQGGDDKLLGGTGDDTIEGGDGADFVSGNGGTDVVRGGNGRDEVRGGPRGDQLFGDGENDILKGFGGSDTLYGGDGNDSLYGGKNNELRLDGGSGTDMCNGGEGDETLTVTVGCTTTENIP